MKTQTREQTGLSSHDVGVRAIFIMVRANQLFKKASGGKMPSNQDMDNTTKINDGSHTGGFGSRKANYQSDVGKQESVVWTAEVASPHGEDAGFSINLLQIEQKPLAGNVQFFQRMPLRSDSLGVIKGIVKNDPNLDDKIDAYNIVFTLTNPKGEVSNIIRLDPKLRLDPRRMNFS